MTDPPISPAPGTAEFAVYAKAIVEVKIEEAKKEIGKENWDRYISVLYGCITEDGSINLAVDGDLKNLPPIMGISIRYLARCLLHDPRYVECRGMEHRVAAKLTSEIVKFARHSSPAE